MTIESSLAAAPNDNIMAFLKEMKGQMKTMQHTGDQQTHAMNALTTKIDEKFTAVGQELTNQRNEFITQIDALTSELEHTKLTV